MHGPEVKNRSVSATENLETRDGIPNIQVDGGTATGFRLGDSIGGTYG
jgi:hypothetical protein